LKRKIQALRNLKRFLNHRIRLTVCKISENKETTNIQRYWKIAEVSAHRSIAQHATRASWPTLSFGHYPRSHEWRRIRSARAHERERERERESPSLVTRSREENRQNDKKRVGTAEFTRKLQKFLASRILPVCARRLSFRVCRAVRCIITEIRSRVALALRLHEREWAHVVTHAGTVTRTPRPAGRSREWGSGSSGGRNLPGGGGGAAGACALESYAPLSVSVGSPRRLVVS